MTNANRSHVKFAPNRQRQGQCIFHSHASFPSFSAPAHSSCLFEALAERTLGTVCAKLSLMMLRLSYTFYCVKSNCNKCQVRCALILFMFHMQLHLCLCRTLRRIMLPARVLLCLGGSVHRTPITVGKVCSLLQYE